MNLPRVNSILSSRLLTGVLNSIGFSIDFWGKALVTSYQLDLILLNVKAERFSGTQRILRNPSSAGCWGEILHLNLHEHVNWQSGFTAIASFYLRIRACNKLSRGVQQVYKPMFLPSSTPPIPAWIFLNCSNYIHYCETTSFTNKLGVSYSVQWDRSQNSIIDRLLYILSLITWENWWAREMDFPPWSEPDLCYVFATCQLIHDYIYSKVVWCTRFFLLWYITKSYSI